MVRTKISWLVVLVPLLLASCGPEAPPSKSAPTKVGGVILIDGKPAPKGEIELKLYPMGNDGTPGSVVANCVIGDQGRYEFNSYSQGDGAAPGDYVLSIEWLRPAPGVMYGPDRFLNNFNSPLNKDPRFQVKVVAGTALEVPTIDIKTSELEQQPSHPYASPSGKPKRG